jgi:hypothetical protein
VSSGVYSAWPAMPARVPVLVEATPHLGIAAMRGWSWRVSEAMSEDDELNRAVGDLFDRYFSHDQTLDDSEVLDTLLPDNSTVLRKRLRAGHHTEGWHFEILGRQLLKRADKAKG